MAEPLVSQSMFALPELNKMELFAIQHARLATTVLDLSAGNLAHQVGLILEHSAKSGLIRRERVAAAQSLVAAVVALLDTLTPVALATEVHKPKPKIPMVVVLESQWFAQATKISMEDYAIQNVKLATPESVQSVGKTASVTPPMLELLAPRNPMAALLESQ